MVSIHLVDQGTRHTFLCMVGHKMGKYRKCSYFACRRRSEFSLDEIKGILAAKREEVVTGPPRRIVVARKKAWESTVSFLDTKYRTSSSGLLEVQFISDYYSEEAIDQGVHAANTFACSSPT